MPSARSEYVCKMYNVLLSAHKNLCISNELTSSTSLLKWISDVYIHVLLSENMLWYHLELVYF